MKSLLPIAAALLLSACANQKKPKAVTSPAKVMEIEGNLAATAPVACVDITELTNRMTPVDMMTGVPKCIDAGDYQKIEALFCLHDVRPFRSIARQGRRTGAWKDHTLGAAGCF